jgi:peptidoglycan/xylan/chitin deacetylase (PgdA/CDA1 family)
MKFNKHLQQAIISFLFIFLTQKEHAQSLKPEIPVLCYHQVRNWEPTDSKFARTYIMPPANFEKQLQILTDSGYNAITPDEFIKYFNDDSSLPPKPILLSFDDGTTSQFLNAVPVLIKYHFTAIFFIMTISLNHTMYMSNQQVKDLNDKGFVIGCHTWDHHNVTDYKDHDWRIQLEKPKQLLQRITGRPVQYFAYPNGIWNEPSIEQLKNYGYKAAFQLADKQSSANPNYTIRRIIVDGNWNAQQLLYAIKHSFK